MTNREFKDACADDTAGSRDVYRILDASINRASEGLRTIEEYARFILDDRALSKSVKNLRHQLTQAVAPIAREKLLASRDTAADVGTTITHPQESERTSAAAVVTAASVRVQQSLRVIEEYGKLLDPKIAADVEALRYQSYSVTAPVEQKAGNASRRNRIESAKLYYLITGHKTDDALAEEIETLAAAGVDVFQLRDRSLDDRTLLQRAVAGTRAANQAGALFIINDRPDIAIAAGADGVHVGQDELPCTVVRQLIGSERLVGISTHSADQAKQAQADGADYVGCGPVFASKTKHFDAHVGTDLIRQVADLNRNDLFSLPAFAIGGIDINNVDQITGAGMQRIAVTSAITNATDRSVAATQLAEKLGYASMIR